MLLLMSLPNIGDSTAKRLYDEGYHSLEDIAFADPELLAKAASLKGEEDTQKIQTAARIALKDKLENITLEEKNTTDNNGTELSH